MDYFIMKYNGKFTKPDLIKNHTNVIFTIIIDVYKHMDIINLINSKKSVEQLLTDPKHVESIEPPKAPAPIAPVSIPSRPRAPLAIKDKETGKTINIPKK